MTAVSGDLFGRVPPPPTQITADATHVMVIDGETLRLDGVVIGLSGVAAPARGEACAAGPDCGGRAAAALAGLVQDRDVACQVAQREANGRIVAHCQAGGRNLNAALVSIGWARAASPALDAVESDARAHRRGIWLAG